MTILTIDKNNVLLSMQKILKLVSSGKELEIKVKESEIINIKDKHNNALKEYKSWKYTVRFTKSV